LPSDSPNAWGAVRQGGVVVILGECIEGSGSALYEETMCKYRTPREVEDALRVNFEIGAHKAYAVTRLMNKAEFILVSSLKPELAKKLVDCFYAFRFPESMRKEFNNDDRFYPITYQKDWAAVREVAEKTGTPYNKSAYDAEAKREADALEKKKQQQQQAPKQ